jgi:hypothetical protein
MISPYIEKAYLVLNSSKDLSISVWEVKDRNNEKVGI